MKATGIRRGDDLEKWLEFRRQHITASDAAAIMGKSPFSTPLGVWMEKTGRKQSKDQEDRALLDWGNRLESVACAWVGEECNIVVEATDEIYVHPEHDWLSCSPDGFFGIQDHKGKPTMYGYLEVKCPSIWTRDHWQHGMPEHYCIQTQLGMEITGADSGILAAVIQPKLFWSRIEPDEGRVTAIIDACWQFKQSYIDKDTPPPMTGSSKEAGFIKELHPEDSGKVIALGENAVSAARRLEFVQERRMAIDKEEKELKNIIKMELGSASYGTMPGEGAYSWLTAKNGARTLRYVRSVPTTKQGTP